MKIKAEIYTLRPSDFNPKVCISGIYLEVMGKLLLMQVGQTKNEAGAWGVPAGKIEIHETPHQAAIRELVEETGIQLDKAELLQPAGVLYIRKPHIDYEYHLFKAELKSIPEICISHEHETFLWANQEELKKLRWMDAAWEGYEFYQQSKQKKKRSGASINVYLILKDQQGRILLSLRKNTGYCDGEYGLVAGHVEDGEPAQTALIREVKEEIGLELKDSDLELVHVMHRQTDRFNLDLFFSCCIENANISNQEPEKCASLDYYLMDELPLNIINYVEKALKYVIINKIYSEIGWVST